MQLLTLGYGRPIRESPLDLACIFVLSSHGHHLCGTLKVPTNAARLTRERVTQPYSLPHHAPAAAHVQGRRARQTTWRLSPPAAPGPGAEREHCRASGRLNCRGPAVGGPNGARFGGLWRA